MKAPNRRFTRRKFLTLSSLSAVSLWAGCASNAGAKTVREIVADARRTVTSPGYTPAPGTWDSNNITLAWLGHSTVLLNFYGVTILTDPALLRRIGANTAMGTIGPKRLVYAPLSPKELPPIDVVLISHAHMDHLDPATLLALRGHPQAVSAKATLDLLPPGKMADARALAWGETTRLLTAHGQVDIRAFEVNHWGARWRYDSYRGYNGYIISREGKHLIFGGDTASTDSFRAIRKFGPFDLAIMPVGAYDPWIKFHCNPEQAVNMANDAGANYFLPIHFKTFPFGREGTQEPLVRLRGAIEPERIGWTDVGQTAVVNGALTSVV